MSKYSRLGGKYTGNHTTLIPLATTTCDIVSKIAEVTKITPGFIKSGIKPIRGKRRVKITDKNPNCIQLSIRDNSSHQEVCVYATNTKNVKKVIAHQLETRGVTVCFTET